MTTIQTQRHHFRPMRARAAAVVAVISMGAGLVAAGPTTAYAGTVRTISPGADILVAMQSLRAGDTLLLEPGTYQTGYLRVPMSNGTAAAPITIAAANPAAPPLLLGGLRLYSPQYVALRSLRIQGTSAGLAALTIDGGIGWTVDKSEFFGAATTMSLSNVTISGTSGFPRAFTFSQNCVHDAANSKNVDQTDHNIYVNFQGSPYTSGTIMRNIVWGAPHGVNIKLGNGGAYGALGPWGVRVANNTLATAGRQLLLHGNVRNNTIVGNLLYYAKAPFVANPKTTEIYVHDVTGTGNYVSHNYGAIASMFTYDPKQQVTYGAGNVMGAEPAFKGAYTCAGWQQTLPASLPFGRWGTSTWSR